MNNENLILFKKGQSGNKSGRPKGSIGIKTLIGKVWRSEIIDSKGDKTIRGLLIVKAIFDKAQAGDVSAFRSICERIEGLPRQEVEINRPVVQMPSVIIDGVKIEPNVGEPVEHDI